MVQIPGARCAFHEVKIGFKCLRLAAKRLWATWFTNTRFVHLSALLKIKQREKTGNLMTDFVTSDTGSVGKVG